MLNQKGLSGLISYLTHSKIEGVNDIYIYVFRVTLEFIFTVYMS